ncbi:MAG: DUF4351 domain-containing protein [Magnetococcus sp. YQC-9]
MLIRLLERRFGALSEADVERIRAAELDRLEVWTDRLLDAATLVEVFADS